MGAGPAGYFTAQAFQKAQNEELSFSIDMIERLPTPWGLVRSGVAPLILLEGNISWESNMIPHSSWLKFDVKG